MTMQSHRSQGPAAQRKLKPHDMDRLLHDAAHTARQSPSAGLRPRILSALRQADQQQPQAAGYFSVHGRPFAAAAMCALAVGAAALTALLPFPKPIHHSIVSQLPVVENPRPESSKSGAMALARRSLRIPAEEPMMHEARLLATNCAHTYATLRTNLPRLTVPRDQQTTPRN
jgi:hypothetical protein